MAITDTVELLGKGLYKGKIPDVLTIKTIPTATELDYLSAENFDKTMLDSVLPKCVEEKINFYDLLEIDYHWLLRCLRILNYGPYIQSNLILCPDCGQINGDYQCNLYMVDCNPIPEGFTGTVKISRSEFIDFNGDVVVKLLTIKDALNAEADQSFTQNGEQNLSLARRCYSIKKLGTTENVPPIEMKLALEKQLSPADYIILGDVIRDKLDFGLRAGGHCKCPKCGNEDARFLTFINDRYFRPTVANLRSWKADRDRGEDANTSGSETKTVSKRGRGSDVHSQSVGGSDNA